MALITCPTCSKEVSAQASTCPGCGHPLATPAANKKRTVTRVGIVLVILLGVLGLIAAVTKPKEAALKTAIYKKYGPGQYFAGGILKELGLIDVNYNDYFVFSTLSVQIGFEPEETVAYGVFGGVIVPEGPGRAARPERSPGNR